MSMSTADFDFIRNLVRQRSAIVLEPTKAYLVESRLAPVARQQGLSSLQELVTQLRSRPRALTDLVVDAMTTNETSFFRDLKPFQALENAIIPELLQARARERKLHIWCGACSSGQEPYSVALLIQERFPQLNTWNVKITATDLSTEMLERAQRGAFSQLEVNRGLPASMLVKHFKREGLEWRIDPAIRRMVDFRPINLAEAWPLMAPADVVLLRNVLIYFDVETKRTILGKIRKLLRPDGYLMLGAAETTLNVDSTFHRVMVDGTTTYRVTPRSA